MAALPTAAAASDAASKNGASSGSIPGKEMHLRSDLQKKRARNSRPSKAASLGGDVNAGGESDVKPAKKQPKTAKERRLASKEMVESRKKKRKPNYVLEKDLTLLWEKMRCHDVSKEQRSKLVSEALRKMDGKYMEVSGSHVTVRVLQSCVKYCTQAERDAIFDAVRPHFLTLARKKYAVHLVKKLLIHASRKQVEWFVSSLHGHVASLLRHKVGAAVVEQVFHLANGTQKTSLLVEMYSTELQLFKDLTTTSSGRLVDIISKLGLQKTAVQQHMARVIQPLLKKGIVDYSIVHTAILEYFTIADTNSAADIIRQVMALLTQETLDGGEDILPEPCKNAKAKKRFFSEPLLVRMRHTREGMKLGIACIKQATAKERKKIVKGLKGHIRKLAFDQYGCLLLMCILSVVDDTRLVTKVVIKELQKVLKELIWDKNGRRPVLQLLHPYCPRYVSPADLACLDYNVPSVSQSGITDDIGETNLSSKLDTPAKENGAIQESKKDPSLRRYELLVASGLAKDLISTCSENASHLLRSNLGRELFYEVAVGGSDGILKSLSDEVAVLHGTIASEAARANPTDEGEENIFRNFFSSRTIRKLVLDSPDFAKVLWSTALEGKCETWAQGHSSKVLTAFLESSDLSVRVISRPELQPLVDSGVLKIRDGTADK